LQAEEEVEEMQEKELVTKEEVDRALREADEILQYAQATKMFSIEKKIENIIRVIVKLAGR